MSRTKPATRRSAAARRKPKAAARRRPPVKTSATASSPFPAIGSEWHGGIYAGIARGRDGGPDYHLIVLAEIDHPLTWDEAMKEGLLPFRKEQALCFANVPELFKPEAYWSCEQHASLSASAWGQYFHYGFQTNWLKNDKFRARLVRRLPL